MNTNQFDSIELDTETVELSGKCPQCNESIHIFVETDSVSCVCQFCGYVSTAKPGNLNLDTFRNESKTKHNR